MVNVAQIPNLPTAVAISGSEQLEAVQAGVSVKVTVLGMATYFQATPMAALTVSAPLQRTANNIELLTVPVTSGGTGLTSFAVGDILYADSTTTLAALADIATGNALLSGGIGGPPAWGKVGLSTAVSGILPIANGGTAAATTTANLVFAGPSSGVPGAPSFRTLVTADLPASGTIPATQGGTGITSYAVGDLLYADTTTTLAKLADVATGNALISGGVATAAAWGKIGLTTHVTGILPIANGGTAAATVAANLVFAGPTTGGAAAPSFRTLVTADIPTSGTLVGPLIFPSRVATAAGTTTMSGTDFEVIINKTIAAANAVTLPASPVLGQLARVSDGKGDSFTNNITISAAAGNINGATTAVMNTNYGCFTFRYSGTEWNIVF
jgi:hypothetical protein